jgi:hypothetical protein
VKIILSTLNLKTNRSMKQSQTEHNFMDFMIIFAYFCGEKKKPKFSPTAPQLLCCTHIFVFGFIFIHFHTIFLYGTIFVCAFILTRQSKTNKQTFISAEQKKEGKQSHFMRCATINKYCEQNLNTLLLRRWSNKVKFQ